MGELLGRKFTRREVVIGGVSLLIGGAVGWRARGDQPTSTSAITNPAPRSPDTTLSIPPENQLYTDSIANEVVKNLGIHAGTFFHVPEDGKLVGSLSAILDKQLFPIFPPAVIAHKDIIYQLSDEFKIAPNVIATIMAMESLGFEEAGSWAEAIGLFQPLQDKFPVELRVKNGDSPAVKKQKEKMMQDPITNGRAGMRYLSDAIDLSQQENNFANKNDVRIFARAFIAYNGGHSIVGKPFAELPTESKEYGDHFIRYALTAEIASGLRKKGYSDKQIVDALHSNEVDARANALAKFLTRLKTQRNYTYDEYNQAGVELSVPSLPKKDSITGVTTDLGNELTKYYEAYKKSPTYEQPMSPGLRIYLASAGDDFGLYYLAPENVKKENWYQYSTSR